jgi:hypothetical protein
MSIDERGNAPDVDFHGVTVHSRYGLQHELDDMCRVLAAIPEWLGFIRLIWCDSKACCAYDAQLVECADWESTQVVGRMVFDALREAFTRQQGGFNYLTVTDGHGYELATDSGWWPGEVEEAERGDESYE